MTTYITAEPVKQGYKVTCWANGYGTFYARVALTLPVADTPKNLSAARAAARRAITRELTERGAVGEGFRVHVARVNEWPLDTDATPRPISTVTFRGRV